MNPVGPDNAITGDTFHRTNGNRWFYTYVLMSEKDGKLYTGTTNDLNKRINQHKNGLVSSTKYRLPVLQVYFETCPTKEDAFRRERNLKTGMGKQYLKNRLNCSVNNLKER